MRRSRWVWLISWQPCEVVPASLGRFGVEPMVRMASRRCRNALYKYTSPVVDDLQVVYRPQARRRMWYGLHDGENPTVSFSPQRQSIKCLWCLLISRFVHIHASLLAVCDRLTVTDREYTDTQVPCDCRGISNQSRRSKPCTDNSNLVLHSDLIWCFKIVFGYVDVHCDAYFEFHCESATRGQSFKLRKRHCSVNSRFNFFTECIVNLWNTLPPNIVNFNSLSSFKRSIKLINFSVFLKCF